MKKLLVERPQFWWTGLHEQATLTRIIDHLHGYWSEVKYFIQRGLYGYSDKDFWNANDHLAYIIVEACETLQRTKKGVPSQYKTWREWDRVLARIAKGFRLYTKYQYDDYKGQKWKKELHMSFKLLEENFENLWD